jgi:hypothetical protein
LKPIFQRQFGKAFYCRQTNIRKENNMPARNELIREYREWITSLKPNIFLTFNFGYPISLEVGGNSVVRFFNRLQRGVYGRNWSNRQTNRHMVAVGFWEHLDSNPHLHIVAKMSKAEWRWLSENGNHAWLEQQKRGQLDFSKIESLEKVLAYIMKEFGGPDSQQRLFTYKAPLNKNDPQKATR